MFVSKLATLYNNISSICYTVWNQVFFFFISANKKSLVVLNTSLFALHLSVQFCLIPSCAMFASKLISKNIHFLLLYPTFTPNTEILSLYLSLLLSMPFMYPSNAFYVPYKMP